MIVTSKLKKQPCLFLLDGRWFLAWISLTIIYFLRTYAQAYLTPSICTKKISTSTQINWAVAWNLCFQIVHWFEFKLKSQWEYYDCWIQWQKNFRPPLMEKELCIWRCHNQLIDHMIQKQAHVLFINLCYCVLMGMNMFVSIKNEEEQEILIVE